MTRVTITWLIAALCFSFAIIPVPTVRAESDLKKLKHIIIVMQENHSFDNYFGALPYVPGGPYHSGPCHRGDHRCVDGLSSCVADSSGRLIGCANSNVDVDGAGALVFAFHEPSYCVGPDLDHSWPGAHHEANLLDPNGALRSSPNDGFVAVNDASEQIDVHGETATEDDTMGFYTQDDLPFYYSLAQTFAVDDRYFSSVLAQTLPNRSYLLAATSFGHLNTNEEVPPLTPPPGGYRPITGTIFDLLDKSGVSWTNYFSDLPTSFIFRVSNPHAVPVTAFFTQAATPGGLPEVSFVDPAFLFNEDDEHPPSDIRKGQSFVSDVVNAVRNGPNWKDSVVFIVYDENGGFYDHVKPPGARQADALTPDGINPGQCADLSNPPASEQPGAGPNCAFSQNDALSLCPGFTPSGPYPAQCANFNQLGFRVPFIAVSPFSKPHYVSHSDGDHTSLLKLIEKRFIKHGAHLTLRDKHAHALEDLFDFEHSPSLHAVVPTAPAPSPADPGCPFVP